MNYRFSPRINANISEISIGSWGLDSTKWPLYDFRELVRAYAMAFELGVNLVDSARCYTGAEETISKVLKEIGANNILISTKISPLIDLPYPISADQAFPFHHVINSTNDSLRALKKDVIDLQQFHIWDPNWLRQESWLDGISELRRVGKVKSFGVSLYDHAPDTAIELVQTGLVDSIQLIYNIFDQSPSFRLLDVCLENNVSVIVRSPLYEGILSGRITKDFKFDENDWRNLFFSGGHLAEAINRAEKVKMEFAHQYTLSELSLKFCLSHPAITTVLVGMKTADHVWENCKASSQFLLSPENLASIEKHNWMSSLK